MYIYIDLGSHRTVESAEWGRAKKSLGTPALRHIYSIFHFTIVPFILKILFLLYCSEHFLRISIFGLPKFQIKETPVPCDAVDYHDGSKLYFEIMHVIIISFGIRGKFDDY